MYQALFLIPLLCVWEQGYAVDVLKASPEKHKCYKECDASSSEMETDIFLEGFIQCEKVHGVRYMHFIADGDRSVYPNLIANVIGVRTGGALGAHIPPTFQLCATPTLHVD